MVRKILLSMLIQAGYEMVGITARGGREERRIGSGWFISCLSPP